MNRPTLTFPYRAGIVTIVFTVIILSMGISCYADDEPVQKKLSLAEAIETSINTNPRLKQTEQGYQNSLSSLEVQNFRTSYGMGTNTNLAHADSDSILSSAVFGSMVYKGLSGAEASLNISPYGFGRERGLLELTLRRPLLSGAGVFSSKFNAIANAQTDVDIENQQLYIAQQNTITNVIEAYYQAVLAAEQVTVLTKAVTIIEEAAVMAHKRVKAELVTELEATRADIRVADTKNRYNQQVQSHKEALQKLMLAIGGGVDNPPELTDPLPEAPLDTPSLEDAVKIALDNRSELAVYDKQLSNQQRRLAVAKDQFRPRLDLVASHNSSSENEGMISRSGFSLGSFFAGLEMRFPLDKRIAQEDREIAARGLDVLGKMRTFQTEQIIEDVQRSYRALEAAKTSQQIFDQNLKTAQDNLTMAQRMVDEGIDDNRNVLEAQNSLTQVENQRLSARLNVYLASMQLKHAMGEDLKTIGTK